MRIRTPADLGLYVRDRRKHILKISQDELAARLGASRHWVMDFEAGHPGVEVGFVFLALAVVGVDLHAVPTARDLLDMPSGAHPQGHQLRQPMIDLSAIVETTVDALPEGARPTASGRRRKKGQPKSPEGRGKR